MHAGWFATPQGQRARSETDVTMFVWGRIQGWQDDLKRLKRQRQAMKE